MFTKQKPFFIFLAMMLQLTLSACDPSFAEKEQDAAFNLSTPTPNHFQQFDGNQLHPAAYYTCGEYNNPCHKHSTIKTSSNKRTTWKDDLYNQSHLRGK